MTGRNGRGFKGWALLTLIGGKLLTRERSISWWKSKELKSHNKFFLFILCHTSCLQKEKLTIETKATEVLDGPRIPGRHETKQQLHPMSYQIYALL
jgi:hypothetical protein